MVFKTLFTCFLAFGPFFTWKSPRVVSSLGKSSKNTWDVLLDSVAFGLLVFSLVERSKKAPLGSKSCEVNLGTLIECLHPLFRGIFLTFSAEADERFI